ncbi:MAG: hypothetical protein LBL66_06555 [Clostridiales bacterium]|jgi:hypothetical protein|nr:hypothetical protein [Clostridiales bacterium]
MKMNGLNRRHKFGWGKLGAFALTALFAAGALQFAPRLARRIARDVSAATSLTLPAKPAANPQFAVSSRSPYDIDKIYEVYATALYSAGGDSWTYKYNGNGDAYIYDQTRKPMFAGGAVKTAAGQIMSVSDLTFVYSLRVRLHQQADGANSAPHQYRGSISIGQDGASHMEVGFISIGAGSPLFRPFVCGDSEDQSTYVEFGEPLLVPTGEGKVYNMDIIRKGNVVSVKIEPQTGPGARSDYNFLDHDYNAELLNQELTYADGRPASLEPILGYRSIGFIAMWEVTTVYYAETLAAADAAFNSANADSGYENLIRPTTVPAFDGAGASLAVANGKASVTAGADGAEGSLTYYGAENPPFGGGNVALADQSEKAYGALSYRWSSDVIMPWFKGSGAVDIKLNDAPAGQAGVRFNRNAGGADTIEVYSGGATAASANALLSPNARFRLDAYLTAGKLSVQINHYALAADAAVADSEPAFAVRFSGLAGGSALALSDPKLYVLETLPRGGWSFGIPEMPSPYHELNAPVTPSGWDKSDENVFTGSGAGTSSSVVRGLAVDSAAFPLSPVLCGPDGKLFSSRDLDFVLRVTVTMGAYAGDNNAYGAGVDILSKGVQTANLRIMLLKNGNVTVRTPSLIPTDNLTTTATYASGMDFAQGKSFEIVAARVSHRLTVAVKDIAEGAYFEAYADVSIPVWLPMLAFVNGGNAAGYKVGAYYFLNPMMKPEPDGDVAAKIVAKNAGLNKAFMGGVKPIGASDYKYSLAEAAYVSEDSKTAAATVYDPVTRKMMSEPTYKLADSTIVEPAALGFILKTSINLTGIAEGAPPETAYAGVIFGRTASGGVLHMYARLDGRIVLEAKNFRGGYNFTLAFTNFDVRDDYTFNLVLIYTPGYLTAAVNNETLTVDRPVSAFDWCYTIYSNNLGASFGQIEGFITNDLAPQSSDDYTIVPTPKPAGA